MAIFNSFLALPETLTKNLNEGEIISVQPDLFTKELNAIILLNLNNENFDSLFLSREIGMSRSQLFRKIKKITGLSTGLYIRNIRLEKSIELLAHTDNSIKRIAYLVGFTDSAYFCRCFKQAFGCSPSKYRAV